MFNIDDVKHILEDYVKCGCSEFILFPFGNNGVMVRNLLKDYFNILPAYIVDNKYCAYNPGIISFDELRLEEVKHCKVILTVEDEDLNITCEELCLENFDRTQVINLKRLVSKGTQILTWKYLEKEYCREAFGASAFLTYLGRPKEAEEHKIKVRILHNGARVWNAFETICTAFAMDERFDTLLILYDVVNDFAEMQEQAKEAGVSYVDYRQYVPVSDQPDIFIYASPFMKSFVKPMCMAAKFSFIIPITLMLYSPNTTERIETARQTVREMEEAGVDYCLAEKYLYDNLSKSSKVSILEFGNPKLDILYRASLHKVRSEKLKKLDNRRIVLFATAHGSNRGRFMDGITFDLYAGQIIDFVAQNPQTGLIFRPHPLFIAELIQSGYWKEEDVIRFKQYFETSENMIWDDNDTYEISLSMTDAIISDGYCGMVLSTLPLMKPICALYRDDDVQPMCPEVDEILYVARKREELDDFLLHVVAEGEDPMFEIRKSGCGRFIKHFDGKNGQRAKDFITSVYLDAEESQEIYERSGDI